MIHPHTQLRFINPQLGYGVFATQFIPKGTITYIKDPLEIEIYPTDYQSYSADMQKIIEKYCYKDERGIRIISWDFGKYVNHCCDCNTMSTGYGFEIAIRDIYPDEEITDEYGLLNIEGEMTLVCEKPDCRLKVSAADLAHYTSNWDEKVQMALLRFEQVEQPLIGLMDTDTLKTLHRELRNPSTIRSVNVLEFKSI